MLFTIDLETSVNCDGIGRMRASPHYEGNGIVLAGWWSTPSGEITTNADVHKLFDELENNLFLGTNTSVILCGMNISFDLAYLVRYKRFRDLLIEYESKIAVWDVQQAQYLLSGQTMMYPSLDKISELWGFPVKPDKIKEYWNSGMATEDIPVAELDEYLRHDVKTTCDIANTQVSKMSAELRQLCFFKGDDILATTIAESVGMHFDLNICAVLSDELRLSVLDVSSKLNDLVIHESGFAHFQPTKAREVSTMLYGGVFSWDEIITEGVFKSGLKKGQPKPKRITHEIKFDGVLSPASKATATELFGTSVADQVLQWILDNEDARNWAVGEFVGLIQEYRSKHKDLSTYYDGYAKLVWGDGMIRPNFQHCATRTGRQSCTQPNLQNVSGGG